MTENIRPLNQDFFSPLKNKNIGKKVIILDEIGSTNDYAKKLALTEEEGTAVLANTQIKGKGRLGRSWAAGKNTDIAMTVIFKPDTDVLTAQRLTLIGGLCVSKALSDITGKPALIKWPNDILLNNKKICGILAEASILGSKLAYCVLGIGINVNSDNFPKELENKAGSLLLETGTGFSREKIIIKILENLEIYYPRYLEEGFKPFIEEYESLCINIGKQIRLIDGNNEKTGFCLGITPAGELMIRDDDGSIYPVSAGEVSVRGLYGYGE